MKENPPPHDNHDSRAVKRKLAFDVGAGLIGDAHMILRARIFLAC